MKRPREIFKEKQGAIEVIMDRILSISSGSTCLFEMSERNT